MRISDGDRGKHAVVGRVQLEAAGFPAVASRLPAGSSRSTADPALTAPSTRGGARSPPAGSPGPSVTSFSPVRYVPGPLVQNSTVAPSGCSFAAPARKVWTKRWPVRSWPTASQPAVR